MSGRGGQPDIARRVRESENYCSGDELTLEGLQEKIAGIPPDVLGSKFFLRACGNERVTLEIVEFVLRAFNDAAKSVDEYGYSPLHWACGNKNMDPGIVRLLLDRWPRSVNHRDSDGDLPLHNLCTAEDFDETASLAILDLLLAAAPHSAAELDVIGDLPIHIAIGRGKKSHPFCKRLVKANPESLRVRGRYDDLPIHLACSVGDKILETAKYMIELYPESIDAGDEDGNLPIHQAAAGEHTYKADTIKYLLARDPDCASKTGERQCLPLHLACETGCFDSVCILFDAYPEAINIIDGEGRTPLDRALGRNAMVQFVEAQLAYARQAEDTRALRTPDVNGWLPLHHALREEACLGAIKLLIAGNRDALQVACNGLAFPLHIACEFSRAEVVQYLLGLSDNHLHTVDLRRDSTLHYACRGGNTDVVKYLLERHVPSVSEPNGDSKLPIHLLWESDRVDRDSVEYVEANWLLLRAHPETVTH